MANATAAQIDYIVKLYARARPGQTPDLPTMTKAEATRLINDLKNEARR